MTVAISLIETYQAWISPYKGFRCAHAVANGGHGCSGFGKRAFGRYPFQMAIRLLNIRLEECRMAATKLNDERKRKQKNGTYNECTDPTCAYLACDPTPADCGAAHGAHDCSGAEACDIGHCHF